MSEHNGRVPLQQYVEARVDDVIKLMDERFRGSDRHWERALADIEERSKQRHETVRETALAALSEANIRKRDMPGFVAVIVAIASVILTFILHFAK